MAVDNKKEQEREELHRAIWAIADDLRGAVDGWDFKNYVLGTMFYRYISENLTAYINSGEEAAGNEGFDYARMSDADAEEASSEADRRGSTGRGGGPWQRRGTALRRGPRGARGAAGVCSPRMARATTEEQGRGGGTWRGLPATPDDAGR